ncbi:MAG: abortive infection family protein [Oenococcus sp.]|uniref:abortive infection family protein n=1 Tax=Oenococcus sp. TaxID=1979414 RepID=UPI0039EAAA4E
MESAKFELLENTDITTFFIDRPWIVYRTNSNIDSLGFRFGVPNPEGSNRASKMSSIIAAAHANNRTGALLTFLFSTSQLRPIITEYLNRAPYSQLNEIEEFNPVGLSGDVSKDIAIVANEIQRVILEKINGILLYSGAKLVSNSNSWSIISVDAEVTISVPTQRINAGYISELLSHGLDALKDEDFDSIVTKSRTLIEDVFLQILEDNHIQFKQNGNITQYRNLVIKLLGMRPSEVWNPRITKMVSHLNAITDLIAEMRNKDSDAHASSERVKIQAAEAELLLNTSVSLATYYLRINDRHL